MIKNYFFILGVLFFSKMTVFASESFPESRKERMISFLDISSNNDVACASFNSESGNSVTSPVPRLQRSNSLALSLQMPKKMADAQTQYPEERKVDVVIQATELKEYHMCQNEKTAPKKPASFFGCCCQSADDVA